MCIQWSWCHWSCCCCWWWWWGWSSFERDKSLFIDDCQKRVVNFLVDYRPMHRRRFSSAPICCFAAADRPEHPATASWSVRGRITFVCYQSGCTHDRIDLALSSFTAPWRRIARVVAADHTQVLNVVYITEGEPGVARRNSGQGAGLAINRSQIPTWDAALSVSCL